jgi:hypothetical protein
LHGTSFFFVFYGNGFWFNFLNLRSNQINLFFVLCGVVAVVGVKGERERVGEKRSEASKRADVGDYYLGLGLNFNLF